MIVKRRMEMNSCMDELIRDVHTTAVEKGWYEKEPTLPHSMMMIVDELTEAMHEFRSNGITDKYVEEMSDVFIRFLDLLGTQSINGTQFMNSVYSKMEVNKNRPHRHGNKPF